METPLHYFSPYLYKNDIELLDMVINVYSVVSLKETLAKRELEALRYYIKYGYSKQTKKTISIGLSISEKHIDQINCTLTKKGFLMRHSTNYREKIVSPKILELTDSFLTKKVSLFTVIFKKDV